MPKAIKDTVFKYRSPWKGIVARRNAMDLQPGEFPFLDNIVLFGDQIGPRPCINPATSAGGSVIGPDSGLDIPLILFPDPSAFESILTAGSYYYQNSAILGYFNWVVGGAYGAGISLLSDTIKILNGVAYFSTQDTSGAGYVSTISPTHTLLQNATNYVGGKYINELANHVLLAGCYDNTGVFHANRLSYSAENLPLVWDPTVNTNAGFIDIVDINDTITGLVNVDVYSYLLRSQGISLINPTGNGALPFSIQHLVNGAFQGHGCWWPGSLDSNGSMAIYVSSYDVELLTINGIQEIGGDATPFIFRDLNNAIQASQPSPFSQNAGSNGRFAVIGSILAGLDYSYPYPMYVLTIPNYSQTPETSAVSIMWICDLSNFMWTRHVITNSVFTAKIKQGFVTPSVFGKINLSQYFGLISQYFPGNSKCAVSPWSASINGFVTDFPYTINFKVENAEGLWGTYRNIRIYYQDVTTGSVTFTCTITGVTETGAVVSNSANVTINGLGDNMVKQIYCPVELSCLLPQISITAPAGSQFSIFGVDVIGQGEELETI